MATESACCNMAASSSSGAGAEEVAIGDKASQPSLVERTREELGVNEPVLHRARKHPRRYEDGGAEPSTIDSPKVCYRRMYYQCVDAAVTTIQDRFHQKDYSMYSTLEQLLRLARIKIILPNCNRLLNYMVLILTSQN